ncbi:hypothetical protein J6590_034653 [Homalodisca vitripennis]|nr:hypothetical protein J6590_034653 [Homalodisca vitripennis]
MSKKEIKKSFEILNWPFFNLSWKKSKVRQIPGLLSSAVAGRDSGVAGADTGLMIQVTLGMSRQTYYASRCASFNWKVAKDRPTYVSPCLSQLVHPGLVRFRVLTLSSN